MIKFCLATALSLAFSFGFFTPALQSQPLEFEGYIESWKQNSVATIDQLNFHANTVVDIAFGNFTFTENPSGQITQIGGLEMSLTEFNTLITTIHAKGGKVKLSLGGASYPLSQYLRSPADATYLAQMMAKVVTQFHLDGIDLDIEDYSNGPYYYPQFPQNTISMIEQLHQLLSSTSQLTLTVPGGGWFEPWQTIIPGVKNFVSYISFMEYNIWIDPSKTFVEQIMWDIEYYQQLWGLTPKQMQLGLMPGKDDLQQNLTLSDAQVLAEYAKTIGMSGVMIWSFNRDYEGQDGNPSGAYGRAIEAILESASLKHKHHKK